MENLNDELPTDAVGWQQFFYERFGDRDWDCYHITQEHLLKRMIGFAMYGSPIELGDGNNEIGYGQKANEHIQNIFDLIWKNHHTIDSNEILIRIIFISCEMQDKKKPLVCRPVFVVKKCTPVMTEEEDNIILYDSCNIFIDESARVYQSWSHFLKNNKLPKCKMYCPVNGQYKGDIIGDVSDDAEDGELKVMLEVHDSPACSITKKLFKGSDRARTAVSIGSTATFVAAAIPGIFVAPGLIVAAAVGGLAVGAYTVGRSAANLIDRKKHAQTIGLSDPDARSSWIDAGVGVLSAGTSVTGIIASAATSGANISQAAAQAAYNALNVASMVGSTTSFIFSGYNIYAKLVNNETPSSLDIFQFASSVLFFHKSVVGFKTARIIISETKSSTLKVYGENLRMNRHKKLFKKAQLEAMSSDLTHSAYQEIISGIQDMDDPNNFFSGLAKLNKDLKSSGERYYITTDDLVKINKAYIIDDTDLMTIGQRKITNSESDNQITTTPKETKIPKSCSLDSNLLKQKVPSNHNLVVERNTPISDTIFATKYTFIIRSVHFLLENSKHHISDFVKESLRNLKDLETITLLLKSHTDEEINTFLDILLRFLIILPSNINDNFSRIFPFVSLLVGALQFLLRCLETDLLHFDTETNDKELVVEFCKQFTEWVDEKLDEINKLRIDPNAERKSKIRKICTECQGFYFVFEE